MVIVAGKFEDIGAGKNKKFLSGQKNEEVLYQKFTKRGHWQDVDNSLIHF